MAGSRRRDGRIALGGASSRYRVRAEYFEGRIDLRRFRVQHPQYRVLASDPLILEPEAGRYAVFAKFGAVIFWNVSETLRLEILSQVASLPESGHRAEGVGDSLEVVLEKGGDRVSFEQVSLEVLTLERIKIVSVALGQSVALDRFENEVTRTLRALDPVVHRLRAKGRLDMRQSEVLRTVGFALEVRSAVLANLTLFDDPPETWESEALAHLDSRLFDHFDLAEREAAINKKIEFISDMNRILLDLLSHRKSMRVEWIIIALIAIELLTALVPKLVERFLR